jgi:hypothetical protein
MNPTAPTEPNNDNARPDAALIIEDLRGELHDRVCETCAVLAGALALASLAHLTVAGVEHLRYLVGLAARAADDAREKSLELQAAIAPTRTPR